MSTQRVVVGEGRAQQDIEKSSEFVLSLAQIIRISRFHQLTNQTLTEPIETVSRLTQELCSSDRPFLLFIDEGQVYVNQQRLRFTSGTYQPVQEMIRLFTERDLSGFKFEKPLSKAELRSFLQCFRDVSRDAADACEEFQQALAAAGSTQIAPIRRGTTHGSHSKQTIDENTLAALLYAKAVVFLRESIRHWHDQDLRRELGTRATRVIQDVITLAASDPRPFLWLLHVKGNEEYLFSHSANVALLSILTGLKLGLDRNRLCELGTAALYHDMGRIGLPPYLWSMQGTFTDEDRRAMERHPVHGVNLLLSIGMLNEAVLERIVVVFEHNIDSNNYPRKEWAHGLHLFSRIVAIADAFDAMTTRREFRAVRTPDEALGELERYAGTRYDSDLVKVFTNVLGIYPLGTIVRLDSGELGVVFHVDPCAPRRPLVKLVTVGGERIEDGELVDLGEKKGEEFCRSIVGTEHPTEHGIDVPSFLFGGDA